MCECVLVYPFSREGSWAQISHEHFQLQKAPNFILPLCKFIYIPTLSATEVLHHKVLKTARPGTLLKSVHFCKIPRNMQSPL